MLLQRALFLVQRSSSNMFFHFSFCMRQTEKAISCDNEVARTFTEASEFQRLLLLKSVLERYVWYKTCSSNIALSNKKIRLIHALTIRSDRVQHFVLRLSHRMLRQKINWFSHGYGRSIEQFQNLSLQILMTAYLR